MQKHEPPLSGTQRPSLRAVVVLFFACFALMGCGSSDQRRAEEFAARWRTRYNSHDLASFTELYAPKGAYRAPTMLLPVGSRDDLRKVLESTWREVPDVRIAALDHVLGSGNRVAFHWELDLTEVKTGVRKGFGGASFLTVENGVITEEFIVFGPLGPLPAPAPKPRD